MEESWRRSARVTARRMAIVILPFVGLGCVLLVPWGSGEIDEYRRGFLALVAFFAVPHIAYVVVLGWFIDHFRSAKGLRTLAIYHGVVLAALGWPGYFLQFVAGDWLAPPSDEGFESLGLMIGFLAAPAVYGGVGVAWTLLLSLVPGSHPGLGAESPESSR